MLTFSCTCVGAHFRGPTTQQYIVEFVQFGDGVRLEREPANPHDSNAIRVYHASEFIGYIARDTAEAIAPLLDSGRIPEAKVTGFESPTKPVLQIKFPPAPEREEPEGD